VPVLASQASPTPYLEEDGLVLASVWEGHMDTLTPVVIEQLLLTLGGVDAEVVGVGGAAGAGLRPTDTLRGRTVK
jgi:hypothetical protein